MSADPRVFVVCSGCPGEGVMDGAPPVSTLLTPRGWMEVAFDRMPDPADYSGGPRLLRFCPGCVGRMLDEYNARINVLNLRQKLRASGYRDAEIVAMNTAACPPCAAIDAGRSGFCSWHQRSQIAEQDIGTPMGALLEQLQRGAKKEH